MAIPTSRTKEKAEIRISYKKCNGCGLCVAVCKDFSYIIRDGKVALADDPVFGCVGCGHCMAICPEGAISIYGRTLSPENLFELPPKETSAKYEQLLSLYQRRRSVREFLDREVAPELIEKIIKAAATSPMGIPPSDVHIVVFDSRQKTLDFAKDYSAYLESMKWLVSRWFLSIMRPFWGKSNDEMFRKFLKPLFDIFINRMKDGTNLINYDAPLSMYFYGSPYTDPADPLIAATYAMLAAESSGLGTCMLGGIHPLIQNGRKAGKLREKYKIKYKSREGIFVIFGWPAVKYRKGIERTFASVEYI